MNKKKLVVTLILAVTTILTLNNLTSVMALNSLSKYAVDRPILNKTSNNIKEEYDIDLKKKK